jgi:hypothetical protein
MAGITISRKSRQPGTSQSATIRPLYKNNGLSLDLLINIANHYLVAVVTSFLESTPNRLVSSCRHAFASSYTRQDHPRGSEAI